MLRLNLTILAAALALGGPAMAATPLVPPVTSICLDVSGQTLPVVCDVPGSRLDRRENICTCPQGTRVEAPVCGPNERAPSETRAYDRARRLAGRDGSLVGDLFHGRRMCVDLRPR